MMLPTLEAIAAGIVAVALPLFGIALGVLAWWLATDDDKETNNAT